MVSKQLKRFKDWIILNTILWPYKKEIKRQAKEIVKEAEEKGLI